MIPALLLASAVAAPPMAQTTPLDGGGANPPAWSSAPLDTVFEVRRGERLLARNLGGRILVEGWEANEVRVAVEPRSRSVTVRQGGGEVELRDRGDEDEAEDRIWRVRVPRWMEVEIRGLEATMRVEDVDGGVTVRTVDGSVQVRGSRGPVRAHSVDGVVEVEDVVGQVVASSGDDDVVVRSVEGSVRVESVDGDLRLRDVDGDRVEATTVDGDVEFRGALRPGGEYRLRTHDGDLTVRLPDAPDVSVFVSTHDGEFRSEFPVTVDRIRGGGELSFTLGDGSARLRLEAFDGDIRLFRR